MQGHALKVFIEPLSRKRIRNKISFTEINKEMKFYFRIAYRKPGTFHLTKGRTFRGNSLVCFFFPEAVFLRFLWIL